MQRVENQVRFGVHIPAYGRHALLELVIEQLNACKRAGVDLVIAVAGDEADADAAMAADMFLAVPNWPLCEKFNASCEMLRDQGVDDAVVLGSDDLLHPMYFRSLHEHRFTDPRWHYMATRDCYAYDVPTRTLRYWEGTQEGTVDSGRCMSRHLLDCLDWRPWEYSDAMSGMGSLQKAGLIRRAPWVYEQGAHYTWSMGKPWRVGIKTHEKTITDLSQLGAIVEGGRERLVRWYGEEMVGAVEGLCPCSS